MMDGQLWQRMNTQPRRAVRSLTREDVPTRPGVYAWYREHAAVYSGRALGDGGLRERKTAGSASEALQLRGGGERVQVAEFHANLADGPERAEGRRACIHCIDSGGGC